MCLENLKKKKNTTSDELRAKTDKESMHVRDSKNEILRTLESVGF